MYDVIVLNWGNCSIFTFFRFEVVLLNHAFSHHRLGHGSSDRASFGSCILRWGVLRIFILGLAIDWVSLLRTWEYRLCQGLCCIVCRFSVILGCAILNASALGISLGLTINFWSSKFRFAKRRFWLGEIFWSDGLWFL